MIGSLVLVCLVTLSGTVATYLYDDTAHLGARLCSGACVGLAALGLVGFVVASLIGLTGTSVLLAAFFCSLPLAVLNKRSVTGRFQEDLLVALNWIRRPDARTFGYLLFYFIVGITFWQIFSRAMIQNSDGISTGLLNNFGDLPFHLSVITRFTYGNNFPPEDPTYAGVRFTYPFMSDFVSAIFLRCGANLRDSMFIENIVLALAFVGLLHRWALVMLHDRVAAVITPLIVLLNGGFGWVLLFSKANTADGGLFGVLTDMPPSLTVIPASTWRWGNAISALLVPQRGFLMGLPLAVIVFTQWWLAANVANETLTEGEIEPTAKRGNFKKRKRRNAARDKLPLSRLNITSTHRMVAAGVVAGLLPLVHAHSFVVVMGMAGCLTLIQQRWRDWISFFIVATIISVPQLWWSTSHSAVNASTFFAFEVGWDRSGENPIWFWLKNTGLFIPLIVAAVLFKGEDYLVKKRLLFFYLPFVLCFIVPNFLKMAPWIWDNIKVLYYWWLASAPLVALLLAQLWRQGSIRRAIAVVLFVSVILAGGLEVAAIALRNVDYGIFDGAGVSFAEVIKNQTPSSSLIVHAPVHNDPVFLTGRRSLMGYPGHIWTHGLEFAQREGEIKRIYAGAPDAEQLLRHYDVDYVVIGPLERTVMPVNDQFFSRFKKTGEVGGYTLYKIKP